jgi:mannose-1-phosphate guanylyltransferase
MLTDVCAPIAGPALTLHRSARKGSGNAGPTTRAIVLAGTQHWGSTPFEGMLRGPLVPVGGLPLIHYPLHWLRMGGVRSATICANSATAAVREWLGDGESMAMDVSYFDDRGPRGAAGCVRDAALESAADTFVVVEGSMVPLVDLRSLLATHHRSGAAATVAVEVDRRRNAITRERAPTPGGVYVFSRRVLEVIAATGFQDIKEMLFERLYQMGERVVTYETLGVSPRVLSYDSYVAVNRWLTVRAVSEAEPRDGYVAVGEGLRHHTAYVAPSATIVGPVLIGPGARVMDRSVIVGPTTIDADVHVEREALVARSALWAGSVVRAGAVVDGTLLAAGARADAGERLTRAVRVRPVSGAHRAVEPATVPALRRRAAAEPVAVASAF